MARIKYSDNLDPIRKKHYGFTFIANHYGQSLIQGQRNNRTRYTRQFQRMQNLQKCVRFWRTMSPATKTAWDNFAATYPQPSKRNSLIPLTGYQLFLKRNHYCFLNFDIETSFMEFPEMVALPVDTPVFTLTAGLNTIDLTELYISNFGIIPTPGQWLQFMAVPFSEMSGQFYEPIYNFLEVLNTYVDGFFLNIETPGDVAGITYSVYLSKPLNKGCYIKSTKIRYMGCFTTKSFLGLSDTPNSYTGQAGKTVKVKADETGLEFGTGGAGGLTCETLEDCEVIEEIQESISDLYQVILDYLGTSIPNIRFGYLYNHYLAILTQLSSSDDWFLPRYTALIPWYNSFASISTVGAWLKEKGYVNWNFPNTGALNTSLFQWRAGGQRQSTGGFTEILTKGYYRVYDVQPYTSRSLPNLSNASIQMNLSSFSDKVGASVRLMKLNPSAPNGTFGEYIGNNGIIYKTVVWYGWEMMMNNLAETLYRDGSPIPKVTDNAASGSSLNSCILCL